MFPCGLDGFLEPNFKREWVYSLVRNKFALENEQNIKTWQREWPTLADDDKKAALFNVLKKLASKRLDDSIVSTSNAQSSLKLLEPYLCVFTDEDTIAWTAVFMSLDLSKQSSHEHEIPTLTFVAHLIDWIRENRPAALHDCVAMLASWPFLSTSRLYQHNRDFPDALERLSRVLPNTPLEQTSAIACAISGDKNDALLSRLLGRPKTDVLALLKHAQSMAGEDSLLSMFASLNTTEKSDIFLENARELGKQILLLYKKQVKTELQPETTSYPNQEKIHLRCKFLHKLVEFGVDCSNASVALLKNQPGQMAITRFFYYFGELSQPWNSKQHKQFMDAWNVHGGFYFKEDMFANKECKESLLSALSKLTPEWTEWFELEYGAELKRSATGLLDPRSPNSLSIEAHRRFHEQTPRLYEHWLDGLPANIELLNDPVVGETAWKHTQANTPEFLFEATLAWIKAPELRYDIKHAHYPLAKLAWSRHGVDLDTSVQKAMTDKECEYRSLAMEAILPGMGKSRWQALMCIGDVFNEKDDPKKHWSEQPLFQDTVRSCIEERLRPSKHSEILIDSGNDLFA